MNLIENYLHEVQNSDIIKYVYHVVSKEAHSLKRYGLCSPRKLYEVDIKLFEKTSKKIYLSRTAEYKRKPEDQVTNEDILDFLDNSPKRKPEFNSNSIFFSFLPMSKHHKDFHKKFNPYIEVKVEIEYLKKLSQKPVIVGPGKIAKFVKWDMIENQNFIDIVEKICKKKPPNKFIFKKIPHLSLDIKHIPYNKLMVISQ